MLSRSWGPACGSLVACRRVLHRLAPASDQQNARCEPEGDRKLSEEQMLDWEVCSAYLGTVSSSQAIRWKAWRCKVILTIEQWQ